MKTVENLKMFGVKSLVRISLVFVAASMVFGCASYNSTYRNYTDASGNNRVDATGEAAVAAGSSHGSFNCINCGSSSYRGGQQSSSRSQSRYSEINPAREIYSSAMRSATSSLSSEISRSISSSIRGW